MRLGRVPVDDQVEALRDVLGRNEVLTDVLAGAVELRLPGWYLTAPRAVYEAKTSRWRRQWPALTVLPWP